MGKLRQVFRVRAPIERCFDLARSVEAHVASTGQTGERAVAGVTTGLLALHDEVTWRAKHLGIWQRLTSRITAFDRPRHFRDSMVAGAFARFDHDHFFERDPQVAASGAEGGEGGVITDVFDYDAPLGPLGRLVERVFLDGCMERFLRKRNELLRLLAESEEWRRFLP